MNADESAVSPVIASILVVAVKVAISAGVFSFVMDISDDTGTSSTSYSSFSSTDSEFEATVVDNGGAGELTYRLNGELVAEDNLYMQDKAKFKDPLIGADTQDYGSGNVPFEGRVDEIRVYRNFDESRVKDLCLMDAPSADFCQAG